MAEKIAASTDHSASEQDVGNKKKLYEKPVISSIQLFADQVLRSCRLAAPCTTQHPVATS